MLPGFDPNQIKDLDRAREAIGMLLNMVEELKQENDALRKDVQQLRDEVNRLKGEQGKPKIKPGKGVGGSDHSSEKERRQPKMRRRKRKNSRIKIDREEELEVDRSQLPEDAEFKGYEPVIIQDLVIRTDGQCSFYEREVLFTVAAQDLSGAATGRVPGGVWSRDSILGDHLVLCG